MAKRKKNVYYICVDFDGTVVEHKYPKMGKPVVGAIEVLKELVERGHKIILYTMRSDSENGEYLTEAVNYLEENGVKLYSINKNPTQRFWTSSPKIYGNIYIDDASLGCPLIHPDNESDRPYVDWGEVRALLVNMGLLAD